MWIVALALRRPYTFTVFAILILIAGLVAITRTPKDIFPSINIPVISVIWSDAGMSPDGMESHITSQFERVLTTTVDNIEHIESQSIYGVAVIKVFLQPTANVASGICAGYIDLTGSIETTTGRDNASSSAQLHCLQRSGASHRLSWQESF